jgi:hypothetical protein
MHEINFASVGLPGSNAVKNGSSIRCRFVVTEGRRLPVDRTPVDTSARGGASNIVENLVDASHKTSGVRLEYQIEAYHLSMWRDRYHRYRRRRIHGVG